eukprot:COSAG02_NODE_1427_length_12664_cov_3.151850_7_plen_126_part_00
MRFRHQGNCPDLSCPVLSCPDVRLIIILCGLSARIDCPSFVRNRPFNINQSRLLALINLGRACRLLAQYTSALSASTPGTAASANPVVGVVRLITVHATLTPTLAALEGTASRKHDHASEFEYMY